jgi:hypothetical protein
MFGQATLPDAFPPVKRAAEKRRANAAHPGEKSRTKREQKVAAAGREVQMRGWAAADILLYRSLSI